VVLKFKALRVVETYTQDKLNVLEETILKVWSRQTIRWTFIWVGSSTENLCEVRCRRQKAAGSYPQYRSSESIVEVRDGIDQRHRVVEAGETQQHRDSPRPLNIRKLLHTFNIFLQLPYCKALLVWWCLVVVWAFYDFQPRCVGDVMCWTLVFNKKNDYWVRVRVCQYF